MEDLQRFDNEIEHMRHPLYLMVTKDKYELPMVVADSSYELAAMAGVNVINIMHAISRRSKRKAKKSRYQIVWPGG